MADLPEAKAGRLRVGGGELESLRLRPPAAAAGRLDSLVIMLHEGLGSVSMWKDFPSNLCQAIGCDVLVYSRFGYGISDPCRLPRDPDYMHEEARVLAEIVAQQSATQIVVLGHSDGASIAAIHAGGFADSRLRGNILMAPHFYTERLALDSIHLAKQAYDQGDLRERLGRYHHNVDMAFRGWNDAWLDPRFHQWDIREYLPRIDSPCLLIQGADDEYGSEEQLSIMQQLAACSVTTRLFPDCRHSPHRDCETLTVEAIERFLSSLDQ